MYILTKPALLLVTPALLFVAVAAVASNQYLNSRAVERTNWYVVEARSISKPLFLNGILLAKQTQTVTAPYETRILDINIVSGQRVSTGDSLVSFDAQAIKLELLDANAKYSEAQQELYELQNWKSSSAVISATRAIEASERRERLLAQKAQKSKKLHQLGIISTDDLNETKALLTDQRSATLSKRTELSDLLAVGEGAKLQFAEFRYETARQLVELLENELLTTKVDASFDGIVYEKSSGDSAAGNSFSPGDIVTANKTLFFVANTEKLMVKASVNELDITNLKEGMSVTVNSSAIPGVTFDGHISRLSARALRSAHSGDSVPTFDVFIDLEELTDEQSNNVRLNVSVTVTAEVYRNESTVVVPLDAIQSINEVSMVTVADQHGKRALRQVETGVIDSHYIEILSGLRIGDRIEVDKKG